MAPDMMSRRTRPEQAMPLSPRSAGLIRALIYPVQFDRNPLHSVDRVLNMVVVQQMLDATPADYRDAIQEALTADDRLSGLIPQHQSEEIIRKYLAAIAHRIEREMSDDTTRVV
jgi:hypothetical protein